MTFNSFATPKNVKPLDIFLAAAYNVNNPDNVVLDDIIERRGDTMLNLKTLREGQHLTQQQLADRLNVGRTTVTMWESGETTPPTKYLLALAEILGCTVDELLTQGT